MAMKRHALSASDLMTDDATGALLTSGGASGASANTFVADGVEAAVAGAVAITLHASTECRFFTFWLDSGSSSVHVKTDGTVAAVTAPKYEDNMGAKTVRLATPATTITVFFDGAVGNLNWIAEN